MKESIRFWRSALLNEPPGKGLYNRSVSAGSCGGSTHGGGSLRGGLRPCCLEGNHLPGLGESSNLSGTPLHRAGCKLRHPELEAQVFLGSLSPNDVSVEIVWGWREGEGFLTNIQVVPMKAVEELPGGYPRYAGAVLNLKPMAGLATASALFPTHPHLNTKHEMAKIEWA